MLKKLSLNLLKIYQDCLRLMLPSSCRFSPSCSEYTKQAILKYGFFLGILKGIKRILGCHPFSARAGDDPLK